MTATSEYLEGVLHVEDAVRAALSKDLLNPVWREKIALRGGKESVVTGHCYVASEALFHLLGGALAGWKAYYLNHDLWPEQLAQGETHWYLRHTSYDIILDPTAAQYRTAVPYRRGKACGFCTRWPSVRAKVVMGRVTGSYPWKRGPSNG